MSLGVDDLLLLGGSMAAIGGGIGMGNMFTTAHTSYNYNKRLLDQQQRWQRNMMQNAHQWQVQDLRKAGLNPILSAGGSPGSYGASSAGSVHVPDPSSGFGAAMDSLSTAISFDKALSEVDLLDAQKKTQGTQADLNLALADKARAEAASLGIEAEIGEKGKNFLQKVGDVSSAIGKNIGDKLFNSKKRLDHDSVVTAFDRKKLNDRLDELIEDDKRVNPHLYEKNSGVYIRNGNSWSTGNVDNKGNVTRTYKTKRP